MKDTKLPFHVRMLKEELNRRQLKNPRYSLRALAMHLELHPSALSRAFTGKQNFSLKVCSMLVRRLKLSPVEARLFVASVAEEQRSRAAQMMSRAIDPETLEQIELESDEDAASFIRTRPAGLVSGDVLRLANDLISMMDLEGRFIYANEIANQVLPQDSSTLIGEKWDATRLGKQTAELFERQQKEVVATKRAESFEFALEHSDRTRHFVRTITPVAGNDGKMHAYISSIRDVTWDVYLFDAIQEMHSSIELATVLEKISRVHLPVLGSAILVELDDIKNGRHLTYADHVEQTQPGEYLRQLAGTVDVKEIAEPTKSSSIIPIAESLGRKLSFGKNRQPAAALVTEITDAGRDLGRLILLREDEFSAESVRLASRLATSAAQAIVNARIKAGIQASARG